MAVILKKNDVKLSGAVKLGPSGAQKGHGHPAGNSAATAKIVETTDQYAVIEFTCSCGVKNYVKCDFQ